MTKINSIVRYFGGKGNGLREIIYSHFPPKSSYSIFLEVFGGGASVLLLKPPFGVEIYNDLEKNVYSLFKVLADKELFAKFKEQCDISLYSHELRNEYKRDLKQDNIDLVERAYKFFYVNRTSINGVGGFSAASACIRRNMSKSVSDFLSTIDGLKEIHDRLSRVIVENVDGIELIRKYDREKVFIYADPPYYQGSRTTTRYKIDMGNNQQKELIDTLLKIKNAKILLSAYNCKEYDRLSNGGWNKIEFKVKTQDGNGNPKTKIEVLWKNYKTQELRGHGSLWS